MRVINDASSASIRPLWLRFCNWINVSAMTEMVLSGLRF